MKNKQKNKQKLRHASISCMSKSMPIFLNTLNFQHCKWDRNNKILIMSVIMSVIE